MPGRPELDRTLDSSTFREYYYLKEELTAFCRENGLPVSGGKRELTERIAYFLDTGETLPHASSPKRGKAVTASELTPDSVIGHDFVCSETHRAFFIEHIGRGFSFNVAFQKWLKANPDRTFADAIAVYHAIMEEKKKRKAPIDSQFEYNTYIRDFFACNPGRTLDDAIKCWKYKKSLRTASGHRYERSDLAALDADDVTSDQT